MTYATTTIGSVIDEINRKYFLPSIQRPFVWSSSKVLALVDSLLRGYPVGAYMFWNVAPETKSGVSIYRFIEHYRDGNALNETASTDGRDVVLVLDGQQRMTSLLIGLRGTYAEKDRYARRGNPDAWKRQILHLDLLKDPDGSPDDDDEGEPGLAYGLRFAAVQPRNSHREHWIRVGSILEAPTEAGLERMAARVEAELHAGVTPYERQIAVKNLRRLHEVILVEEAVNYYTETRQSFDRVLDIFVRANDGGVKLGKSDLMMSMITSRWRGVGTSAKEEVARFVEHINRSLDKRNEITRDFVLKASLVLCELDVRYSLENFSRDAITTIETNWEAIKGAIEGAFRLINSFGITGENLTSVNAVLPIAYFLYRNPGTSFRGSSEFERVNARKMHRWLVQSLLTGSFAGSSDRTITLARRTIRDSLATDRNFPETALYAALATSGRLSRLDARGIEEVLELRHGKGKTFLALSLLYDGLDWGTAGLHVDHIIPQAMAARRVLQGQNLREDRISAIQSSVDRLGNLQLLPPSENMEKSDLSFDAWITSRDRRYLERHLIRDRPDLWRPAMLPKFVEERENLIRRRLSQLLSSHEEVAT
jgi:hypothetical protein